MRKIKEGMGVGGGGLSTVYSPDDPPSPPHPTVYSTNDLTLSLKEGHGLHVTAMAFVTWGNPGTSEMEKWRSSVASTSFMVAVTKLLPMQSLGPTEKGSRMSRMMDSCSEAEKRKINKTEIIINKTEISDSCAISYLEPSNFLRRMLDENERLWKGPVLIVRK